MCGIVGLLNLNEPAPISEQMVCGMLAMLHHRGPDGLGIYRDDWVGLGSARLSIVDLSGGFQPISNEDGSLWIVFNGEIFNYVELRAELERRGHRFATHADTEVIVHLYEEEGPACLRQLNGQFAIALWDARKRQFFLARDRVGILPVYYTLVEGQLVFGSEMKAILAHGARQAQIDPQALAQIFTYWSTPSPRTIFTGIQELPPAHYLMVQAGRVEVRRYWQMDFAPDTSDRTEASYQAELESLLIDATRIRLRADVPVGAYLSGGLDSSLTATIIRNYTQSELHTFSIAFADPAFDESPYQRQMAEFLETRHWSIYCTDAEIGQAFPQVIWHTETPVLRTSPAPMFMLSRLTHEQNFKVIVTGEGADEFLGGYDIFKEMKIRRFWAKQPASKIRPLLLQRLYPDISQLGRSMAYLTAFFQKDLTQTDAPFYSHLLRWQTTARTRRFLAQASEGEDGYTPEVANLPAEFSRWSALGQAQYLEVQYFLSPYLLSSQVDRVAMAHSVEGRFPFLDHRVIEFCNRLPPTMKLRALKDKWLLRQWGRRLLPPAIQQRPKRPYRAPIQRSFFGADAPSYPKELLSEAMLRESGCFKPAAVAQLMRKAEGQQPLGEMDNMALAGIVSTQLVYQQFIKDWRAQMRVHAAPMSKLIKSVNHTTLQPMTSEVFHV